MSLITAAVMLAIMGKCRLEGGSAGRVTYLIKPDLALRRVVPVSSGYRAGVAS